MLEVVEERDDMCAAWMGGIGGDEALEKLDFVQSCFRIPWSGLDDFECDMSIHPRITKSIAKCRDAETMMRFGTLNSTIGGHTCYLWRARQC